MKIILFILLAFGSHLLSFAQPGALDLSFDPGTGANDEIYTTSIQQDGKIIIGGRFTSYDGHPVNKVARLNPNGSLDTAFQNLGLNSTVWASAIQQDGKIIIAGRFIRYNNFFINRIIRLNTDGSRDTTFNPGSGFDDYVYAIAIQSDGKILAGGNFTTFNGSPSPHLARLNPDGSIDSTFNIGSGPNYTVEDIAIQPFDDKIIICGDFSTYQGTYVGRIARLNTDGSRDSNEFFSFGTSSVAYASAVQDDRKIMLVGSFHNYNNIQTGRIARLHHDGDRDSNFDPGLGASADIKDIEILTGANGARKYLIIGDFVSFDLTPITRIALLDTFGNLDPSFDPGTGADSILYTMSRQQDGRIIIGGEMATYDGVPRGAIARIYACETSQPGAISGSDTIMCAGEVFVYAVPQTTGVKSYEWTLPSGWMGSSDSSSITVVSNGQGGVISVRAFSDSCGYSDPQTKTVYRNQPPEQPICLVTVDDQSTHNILIWEKMATNLIDSFFIYRETSTNVYTRIATVPYDSLSEYHDTTANPNSTSYRYKISALDTCGVETDKSVSHRTIHLQNLGLGNFQWTFYEIDNSPDSVISFNVYRDDLGVGNFIFLDSVPGNNNTFTDINYQDFPNSNYVIDANWRISCTPQRGTINTTRSNIRKINVIDTFVVIGMETILPGSIEIYPNPAENILTLHFSSSVNITRLQLFNPLGQMVWSQKTMKANSEHTKTIHTGELPKGVYVLAVETKMRCVKKKVIIQ